jgi:hypothetical protein
MRRDELEARVLTALQTRFFESAPFQVFCEEFTAAVNEARMEARAAATVASRERAKIDSEIAKLVQFIKDGVAGESVRGELLALETRKAALESERTLAASEVPPLLHANMADRWRAEVTQLRDALAEDRCDRGASGRPEHGRGDQAHSARWRPDSRCEGEPSCDVGGYQSITRLAAPNGFGCGGVQQIVPAALLGGSVNVKTLAFPTEVPVVRLSVG